MRDFDMHGHGRRHGHRFGGHSMAKPLMIGAVLFVVLGLLVMSLWNALLPAIIGVKSIGFWQALGLLVLCRILFGGLGFRPGMFGMGRERRRMHERWMKMTPEEREQFVQQRRGGFWRHGHHHHGERHGHCHHRHEQQAYEGPRGPQDVTGSAPQAPEDELAETLFGVPQSPEDEYLSELVWHELQEALAELPAAQREAFEKTELHGYSFKELAEETGVSVQALLSRKHKAVLYLRTRLRNLYDELTEG